MYLVLTGYRYQYCDNDRCRPITLLPPCEKFKAFVIMQRMHKKTDFYVRHRPVSVDLLFTNHRLSETYIKFG